MNKSILGLDKEDFNQSRTQMTREKKKKLKRLTMKI